MGEGRERGSARFHFTRAELYGAVVLGALLLGLITLRWLVD